MECFLDKQIFQDGEIMFKALSQSPEFLFRWLNIFLEVLSKTLQCIIKKIAEVEIQNLLNIFQSICLLSFCLEYDDWNKFCMASRM